MNISNVFDQFCNYLQNRTEIMTEDNIRYYWFASMLNQDPILNNYTLEQPYSDNPIHVKNLPNEELDLLYNSSDEIFCFEIKFHKKLQRTTLPKTAAAGSVVNDLQRLQQISPSIKSKRTHRLLLYVTDTIMHDYYISMQQPNTLFGRHLYDFYKATVYTAIYLDFSAAPETFLNSANKSFKNPKPIIISNLLLIHSRDFTCKGSSFKGDCHVRLYEIY